MFHYLIIHFIITLNNILNLDWLRLLIHRQPHNNNSGFLYIPFNEHYMDQSSTFDALGILCGSIKVITSLRLVPICQRGLHEHRSKNRKHCNYHGWKTSCHGFCFMFNNNLSSLWNIKIIYYGAKFWDMTPNLVPNNLKGRSEKFHDVTNTLDHSNHSLYFVEGQRSTPCIRNAAFWLVAHFWRRAPQISHRLMNYPCSTLDFPNRVL